MSIKYNGNTVVGPGNEPYIKDGKLFCGNRDLGIKVKPDIQTMTSAQFNYTSEPGLYYVTGTEDDTGELLVELWHIDDLGRKTNVNSNHYVLPVPGENGNWFINGEDTGYPYVIRKQPIKLNIFEENWSRVSGTQVYAQNVTCKGLVEGDDITVKLDVQDSNLPAILNYKTEFDKIVDFKVCNGYIRFISTEDLTLTIPVVVNRIDCSDFGHLKGGAMIDDTIIDPTTTWSSKKINDENTTFQKEIKSLAIGKNLEFTWLGSQLGVRQQGYESYRYRDLKGPAGLCGIDGSSIVDATVSSEGDLLLTIQDDEVEIDTTKMLTLESGAFTAKDLLALQNSINRINNDLAAVKTGAVSQVIKIKETSTEYKHIMSISGCGTIQFFTTRFTGKVKIGVDGTFYEGVFDSIVNQSDNNLLVPDVESNRVIMNSEFASDQTTPLNFTFSSGVSFEIMATTNTYNLLPSILIQGDYYSNGEYGEESSEPIDYGAVSDEEIDDIFDSIFGEDEANDLVNSVFGLDD